MSPWMVSRTTSAVTLWDFIQVHQDKDNHMELGFMNSLAWLLWKSGGKRGPCLWEGTKHSHKETWKSVEEVCDHHANETQNFTQRKMSHPLHAALRFWHSFSFPILGIRYVREESFGCFLSIHPRAFILLPISLHCVLSLRIITVWTFDNWMVQASGNIHFSPELHFTL